MLDTTSARSVIDHAISVGADFAELFVERNQVNSVSTLSSEVQAVQSGIDFGIGVRIVYGSKVLYGYTNKTDADELRRNVTELSAKDLRDPSTSSIAFDFSVADDIHQAEQTLSKDSGVESKVGYLLAADRTARAASNLISQTRGSCTQHRPI